jgi:hypothetical protein
VKGSGGSPVNWLPAYVCACVCVGVCVCSSVCVCVCACAFECLYVTACELIPTTCSKTYISHTRPPPLHNTC